MGWRERWRDIRREKKEGERKTGEEKRGEHTKRERERERERERARIMMISFWPEKLQE
jgi:hypothetical protein